MTISTIKTRYNNSKAAVRRFTKRMNPLRPLLNRIEQLEDRVELLDALTDEMQCEIDEHDSGVGSAAASCDELDSRCDELAETIDTLNYVKPDDIEGMVEEEFGNQMKYNDMVTADEVSAAIEEAMKEMDLDEAVVEAMINADLEVSLNIQRV